ncbi:sigma-70 family RNA polymerase sigma factor [Companilactobacillus halodurans]|uniref:Sigma-70 family RNA polymerase sigma factor n=1 Tax=Companilactobacillus halodurans TaxID=2584183 RepID=A0A5P0ZSM1_9LACO|nr:sigma-70 family RNA polymerase sigma factor [Companilactobacillus halodurans]MQS76921.1 sigma-70 family RNA polymerase sigma factor [Companilactobacillus halodurans]MQS96617.1 sigma-70 family RNA polymerase sigma factor [Companilactobacillus halodurans]
MNLELGFEEALKNQRLIHGVLKRVHIYPTRVDYEDYFQEGLILYAQTYVDYCQKNNDLTKFNVYVYQKLTWRMLDWLRQEKRYTEFHSLEEYDFQQVPEKALTSVLEFVNYRDLSVLERIILQEYFINGLPLVILSKQYKKTTRALRYCRDRLLKKLRVMYEV